MNPLKKLLDRLDENNKRVLAVLGGQWGDEGKGKLMDSVSEWADVIARGTGGANAGHTIVRDGRKFVCHILPSGILHDAKGKLNVIGRGVALDPAALLRELGDLGRMRYSSAGLRISHLAHLVTPLDILLDVLGNKSIGTTGRGIGPTYMAHVGRYGLIANDLLNTGVLLQKVRANLEARIHYLKAFDPKMVRELMHTSALQSGAYWCDDEPSTLSVDRIMRQYAAYGAQLAPMICDTDELMGDAVRNGQRVVLEGAQGILLSVDHGTQPFVTSSDCGLDGLARGVGLRTEDVDHVLTIIKGPYMTRVGNGPFPTELGGGISADWCREATKEREVRDFPAASINDPDPLVQGIALRQIGDEYGATTGRPRRTGWLDLPLLRHAMLHAGRGEQGRSIVLTKSDVLDTCSSIPTCVAYRYRGPTRRWGSRKLKGGERIEVAIMDAEILSHCEPCYVELPGWQVSTRKLRKARELPKQLHKIIKYIEITCDVEVRALSVGPDTDDVIVL